MCLHVNAQTPLFNGQVHFKVEDGLPQSFVSDVIQDSEGFIWVGTRGGIARYDGKSFLNFTPNLQDSNAISSAVVMSMANGPANGFLIKYENVFYDIFNPHLFQTTFKKELLWAKSIQLHPELIDSKGRWWMRNDDGAYSLASPAISKNTLLDNIADSIMELTESPDGNVYAITANGVGNYVSKANRFDVAPFKLLYSPKRLFYRSCWLRDGRLVLPDNKRLVIYNPATKTYTTQHLYFAKNAYIGRVQTGPDGLLYVECEGSVYRETKDGQFELLWTMPESHIGNKEVLGFLIDKAGVLWVGTNANGLYKVNLQTLPMAAMPYKVNFHSDVLANLPGYSSNAPVGWENNSWSYHFRYHYTQDGRMICSFPEEKQSGLTVLSYFKGVWSELPAVSDRSIAAGGLTSIGDTIYAINKNGGLWRWNSPTASPEYIDLHLGNLDKTVIDLVTDGKYMLVITERKGIYKFLNNKLEQYYPIANPEKSTIPFGVTWITCVKKNNNINGRFWVATMGHGVLDWDIDKGFIQSISEKDGLPSDIVYTMTTDANDRLWVGTNKGLSLIAGKGAKIYTFQQPDGLPGNEFNRFHVFSFADGKLAFGGLQGYIIFNPSQFGPDTSNPKIAFTSLAIKNVLQLFGQSAWLPTSLNQLKILKLPHNENHLSLSFAAVSFGNPRQLSYRYRLKGYDKNWIEVGNGTTANYTGLPSGQYTFEVNAANTAGQWSRYQKQLIIQIDPPFWATGLAYTLYAVLIFLFLRTYWRFRENRLRLSNEIIIEQDKARQLQEMDEIKTRFFDNITHELRTPLTLILLPLERMLNQTELPAVYRKTISYARDNASRLLGITNQMLDISKTASGKMQVELKLGHLVYYVEECIHAFATEAEKKNIALEQSISAAGGLFYFDADKWGKIIFNLIGNALKFTPEGGTIKIRLWQNNNISEEVRTCYFTVEDNGIGIAPDVVPHIFDRFYTANNGATDHTGGTGIGLALAKELVQLMQGHIYVESMPGKGSLFTVMIPLKKAGLESPQMASPFQLVKKEEEAIAVPVSGEEPLLLVAEDNDELRQFLKESLQAKWRVVEAPNGLTAWEIAQQELPDLVISDVMMPGMNGYELCSAIKKDNRIGHIPVLLLTAKAAQDSRLEGWSAGANDYLPKPFHFNELELKINNCLEQQERLKKHLQQQVLPAAPPQQETATQDPFVKLLYTQLDILINEAEVDVDALATAMQMGRRTLGRKLKTLLDITPNELIRRYRLQKAAILLSTGTSATQAAYSVGFDSPSYFSQCFKEQYGMSPSEFATHNKPKVTLENKLVNDRAG
jgi:signal transduction histidine kinase/DNA-binding response OmpR family regulator